ncbi:MAG TPA: polysaccharide biosynthesis tyrosine autokinase [Gaiellaceae bacterium]|nr:polysaccharide biosynthesis tyrosine autokinase [Gaiellaceae bacterium]
MSDGPSEHSSFIEFLRIARRRKWLILAAIVVVPLAAYYHAKRQPPVFQASSQVLLTPQNPAAAYAGVGGSSSASVDPVRYGATQSFLARSPAVVNSVLREADNPNLNAGILLGSTSVTSLSDANLLVFTARGGTPDIAQQLANLYAQGFTQYRRHVDSAGVKGAMAQLQKSLDGLGKNETALRGQIIDKLESLRTIQSLQAQATYLARPAGPGIQVAPRPQRDAMLGLVLGIVIGVGLAFLRDASDTRIRTTDEIGDRLGMPLLGHLPELDKRSRAERRLVMLDEPYGASAEMFRMLRTSIDLANLDRHAHAIMVTSASEGEGKTTTACNLAIAFAASGRRVVLLDLDLRRPTVHNLLGLASRPGLTDVAVGQAALTEALVKVTLEDDHSGGSFMVLPSGPMPPNPGEFAGTTAVGELLAELQAMSDLVIVDTPPVLQVAEAMSVSSRVDAMLVVVNVAAAKRGQIAEMHRQLERSPVKKLGFVAIGGPESPAGQYEHYAPFAYPVDDLVS